MPAVLKIVITGVGALVLLHLAVPVVMLANKAGLRADTSAANPALTPAQLDAAVVVAIAAAVVFHLLFCAAYTWFGVKAARGRRWARVALTITLVLSTLFSAVSWSSSSMFHTLVIVSDLLQVILIGLLWIPSSARGYFELNRRE
jgi:hypothetical protein